MHVSWGRFCSISRCDQRGGLVDKTITIKVRDKPKIKVKLIGKRVFKVKLTNQQYMPAIPNINDLILNYKIGRL